MIELARRNGRPLRIGHRGAGALAPENTLRSFRAAVAAGVDLVEFDVFELSSGDLVVAHSNDLYEVSHGTHRGTVRSFSLAALREACPDLPTLEEALAFFVDEAPHVGLHVDLKTRGRERDVVARLHELGLRERVVVSTFYFRSARALSALDPGLTTAFSLPRTVAGITENGRGAAVARVGLALLRWLMPAFVRPALAVTRARALALHRSVVGEAAVRRAHRRGAAVIAWTVDDVAELARVDAAGVDAVVTNDPAIFASTLET